MASLLLSCIYTTTTQHSRLLTRLLSKKSPWWTKGHPKYQMGLEKSQSNLSSRNKSLIKHKSLLLPFRVHAIFRAFVTTIQLNSSYKWELRNCLFDCGWRDFEKCLMAPQNFPLALFRSINLCENLSRQPTTRFLHGDAGMVPIMFYASYMPPQPPPG